MSKTACGIRTKLHVMAPHEQLVRIRTILSPYGDPGRVQNLIRAPVADGSRIGSLTFHPPDTERQGLEDLNVPQSLC